MNPKCSTHIPKLYLIFLNSCDRIKVKNHDNGVWWKNVCKLHSVAQVRDLHTLLHQAVYTPKILTAPMRNSITEVLHRFSNLEYQLNNFIVPVFCYIVVYDGVDYGVVTMGLGM